MRTLGIVIVSLMFAGWAEAAPVPTTHPANPPPEVAALLVRIAALEARLKAVEDQNRVLRAALVGRKVPEPPSQPASLPAGSWTIQDLERFCAQKLPSTITTAQRMKILSEPKGRNLAISVKIVDVGEPSGDEQTVWAEFPLRFEGAKGGIFHVGVEATVRPEVGMVLRKDQTVRIVGKIFYTEESMYHPGQPTGPIIARIVMVEGAVVPSP